MQIKPESAQLYINRLVNTNLSRIKQVQWIDRLFDGSHQLYGALSKFRVKVFAFANANAMLACAYVVREQISSQQKPESTNMIIV